MKRFLSTAIAVGIAVSLPAFAQEKSSGSLMDMSIMDTPSSAKNDGPVKKDEKKAAKADKKTNGTEITSSKEMSFVQKDRKVIYVGDVTVVDPQFSLKCDRMTAFLKEEPKKDPAAKPTPKPEKQDEKAPGGSEASSLERVIAEGNVVIVATRPGEKEGEVTKYTARSAKAVYESKTGDMTLTGWPQVARGINSHIATEESTVMIINRDGQMHTTGHSKTVIQEKPDDTKIAP